MSVLSRSEVLSSIYSSRWSLGDRPFPPLSYIPSGVFRLRPISDGFLGSSRICNPAFTLHSGALRSSAIIISSSPRLLQLSIKFGLPSMLRLHSYIATFAAASCGPAAMRNHLLYQAAHGEDTIPAPDRARRGGLIPHNIDTLDRECSSHPYRNRAQYRI